MKKIFLFVYLLVSIPNINAKEFVGGIIVQNEVQKNLLMDWDQELSLDDGNLAFQIMKATNDPELYLTIPQRKVLTNSLIMKGIDGKYRLLVGLFWKGSKNSKKTYKFLVDTFGKRNVKIIRDLTDVKFFDFDIFKKENVIKKDKFWGIAG